MAQQCCKRPIWPYLLYHTSLRIRDTRYYNMNFNILQPLNRVQLPGAVKITCLYAKDKKLYIGLSNGDLSIMSVSTPTEAVKAEQRSIRSLRSLSEFKRLFLDNELSQLLVPELTFKNVTGNQAPITSLDSLPLYQDHSREVLAIGNPETLQVFEWVGSHLNLVFSFDDIKSYSQYSYVELTDNEALKRVFLLGSHKKLSVYEAVHKSRNVFDFVFQKEFPLKGRLRAITCFPQHSLAVLSLLSSFLCLDLDEYRLSELHSEQSNNFTQSASFSYFGLSTSGPAVNILPYSSNSSLVIRDSEVGRLEFDNGPVFRDDSKITLLASPIKTAFLRPNYLLVVYAKYFEVLEISSGQIVQSFTYHLKLTTTLLCVDGSVVTLAAGNSILQFSYLSFQKQLDQFLSARGKISPSKKNDVSNDLRLFGLERAISLVSLLSETDELFASDCPLKTKNLHLRDLYKEKALVYFESYSRYHEALVDIASDWIITYTEFLHLFPDFLNGNIQIKHEISQDSNSYLKSITLEDLRKDEKDRKEKLDDFLKAVSNLIIYLTDQRRIHLSLLSSTEETPSITWKSVSINAADLYPGVDNMKLKSRLEISACAIDTTLFLCYFYVKPLLLGPLLRLPNNKCDASIVNKCILESLKTSTNLSSYMSQLLDFYFGRSLHEDALAMLHDLSRDDSIVLKDANKFLMGPGLTVRYLQKLSNAHLDLVFSYAKTAIDENPDSATKIAEMVFMNETYECESYDSFKVLEFLEKLKSPKLCRRYLEWLLQESDILDSPSRRKDRDKLGTKLCLFYLEDLKSYSENEDNFSSSPSYEKLHAILNSGRDFVPWTVLKNIPPSEDKFLRLSILVYRRLGEHLKSVDILYNQLGDFDSAMHYCAEVYKEPSGRKLGQDLLHKLLEDLLMHYEENVDYVAKLLTSEGGKMSPLYILTALPKTFPLDKVCAYLESSLSQTEEEIYTTRTKGQLYKIGTSKLRRKLLLAEAKSFLVSENDTCPICKNTFGPKVLCLTPNDEIVHYGCVTK